MKTVEDWDVFLPGDGFVSLMLGDYLFSLDAETANNIAGALALNAEALEEDE